jgi:hypothetical protein
MAFLDNDNCSVTVELRRAGDYKVIIDIIEGLHLHVAREVWQPWQANSRRRVTITFRSPEGAAFAAAALTDFLPSR